MFSVTDHIPARGGSDKQFSPGRSQLALQDHPRVVAHHFSGREVRPASREVVVDGTKRKLQPRAFDLLVYLIEHRHRVLSIDELLDAVWRDRDVQVCSLATAIARIRAVLGAGASGDEVIIQTHHRVGYRFVAVLECDARVAW
ncbi:DNA-binding winged helix-turn-helix (wHTH) protein [Pelomonas aquatica]|uniref:DNA-binding winged helix-turn-helix (WHTH) protein n=1 Tax=Pelomonas aquatica TaxID=431058 RepID=A0ABU1ZBM1_9BURK|nr:winged helix-turn-helix domain-containing protein [Pelomonas aquatica]MDR7297436.1 DNA-binding winged helix-turn-helix (wHTH) protein [Pelomonas aquatica]